MSSVKRYKPIVVAMPHEGQYAAAMAEQDKDGPHVLYSDYAKQAEQLAAITAERDRLREAVSGLLRSADCSWYERNDGHDWRDAVDTARAALQPKDKDES